MSLEQYTPIKPREKFAIAREDSFDRGTVILGALLGGEALSRLFSKKHGRKTPSRFTHSRISGGSI